MVLIDHEKDRAQVIAHKSTEYLIQALSLKSLVKRLSQGRRKTMRSSTAWASSIRHGDFSTIWKNKYVKPTLSSIKNPCTMAIPSSTMTSRPIRLAWVSSSTKISNWLASASTSMTVWQDWAASWRTRWGTKGCLKTGSWMGLGWSTVRESTVSANSKTGI